MVEVLIYFFMLPKFPEFKKLELSDRADVEAITSKYPPYSDFNFTSMWCWDVYNRMEISDLYGNLVVKFTDYMTGEEFFSFLGDNDVHATINELFKISLEKGIKPRLKLIPESSIQHINKQFDIIEDRDNFDYVYFLQDIALYSGTRFMKKRNKANHFVKNFQNIQVRLLDLNDEKVKKLIITLDELWGKNKIDNDPNFKIENEVLATKRLLSIPKIDAVCVGVFIKEALIGYSVVSFISNQYAISHFSKANLDYKGVYEFLMRENARILVNMKCEFLNYEQDLGIDGLRTSKQTFGDNFLKKHTVCAKE